MFANEKGPELCEEIYVIAVVFMFLRKNKSISLPPQAQEGHISQVLAPKQRPQHPFSTST